MSISQRLIPARPAGGRLWRKRTGIMLMLLVMSVPVFISGIASAQEEIQPVAVQLNKVEPKEETSPVAAQVTEVPRRSRTGRRRRAGHFC